MDAHRASRLCILKNSPKAAAGGDFGIGELKKGIHMLHVCCQDKKEKKDRKRRRGAAAVDEGWEDVTPEEMSAAAELLAEEMRTIKAAMDVQASKCPCSADNDSCVPRLGCLV